VERVCHAQQNASHSAYTALTNDEYFFAGFDLKWLHFLIEIWRRIKPAYVQRATAIRGIHLVLIRKITGIDWLIL
jgi:hypothetical protein